MEDTDTGFVNRRSGVQSPQPAPEKPFISEYLAGNQASDKADKPEQTAHGGPPEVGTVGRTLSDLIATYQSDEDSPFQRNRFHVRKNRTNMLKRISARHGDVLLSNIRARVLLAWHKAWSHDGKHLASGSAFVGQLRTLFSFGATLIEDPDCERLCRAMHEMRFEGTKPRKVNINAVQAQQVCEKAREHFGWYSLALGQAFQFECTLRQKDVVGEHVPNTEKVTPLLEIGDKFWLRGIIWEEVDDNLILRHITSKKQKLTEVDLKLAPLVMVELQILAGDTPLVERDTETGKITTINRHLLPATGPIIWNDVTGLPWSDNEYRRKWRIVANACGIPKDVFNMDSRSGAISEGIAAGANIEWVRHAATHSDISQTADYDRNQAEATAKVMRLRMESREKARAA